MKILPRFGRTKISATHPCLIMMLAFTLFSSSNVAKGQTDGQIQFGLQSNWQLELSNQEALSLTKPLRVQQRKVGFGFSQVVGRSENKAPILFIASANRTKDKSTIKSTVARYDSAAADAKVTWTYEFESKLRTNQQTFSGSPPSPQSTPLLIGKYLIHLSFTGQLTCLEQSSGKQIWRQDAVTQFDGEPVQFGFSSSPIANPLDANQFLILLAGEQGGLLNVDASSGKIIWKCPCQTFSYATPVAANFGGVRQLVISSKNRLIGVDQTNGARLWDFPMTEKGLTNVPAPIIINDANMVASCQGLKGARGIQVNLDQQGKWKVKERWHQPRMQFFYTNWLKLDSQTVIGCIDKFLIAFDASSGQVRGKFRGFPDGNLIDLGNDQLAIVDGNGNLSRLTIQRDANGSAIRLTQTHAFPILQAFQPGRVWTPLSKIGSTLFLRSEDKLITIELAEQTGQTDQYEEVSSTLQKSKSLELEAIITGAQSQPDPVDSILDLFQTEGQQAAWQKYQALRNQGKLNLDARIQLIEAAQGQGLATLAITLIKEAKEDFPDKASKKRLGQLR